MASIERFEDIEAWKEARRLAAAVYEITKGMPLARDFGLRDQLQRAAVSIMANIAEGFDSRSDQEFIRFLGYAFRSASELQSHLYIALDHGYIDQEKFAQLYSQAVGVKKLLNGFIRYLQFKPRGRSEQPATDSALRTTDKGAKQHENPHS